MGKGIIIIVLGAILVSSYSLVRTKQTTMQTESEQIDYEETILAREIALSAFDNGVSNLKRGFKTWRSQTSKAPYQGGTYDLKVVGDPDGPVTLTAIGHYGDATYTVSGSIERVVNLEPMIFDHGEVEPVGSGNSYIISGIDTAPPSDLGLTTAPGPNTHGIRATLEVVSEHIADNLPADQVIGINGTGDIVWGDPKIDIDNLFSDAITYATHTYNGKTEFKGNEVLGSPESPAVVNIFGEAKLAGTVRGYGILYVDGKTKIEGNVIWEGLILIDDGAEKLELKGHAQIYGSIIARGAGEADADRGLAGGHFDVDVFNDAVKDEIYHEHQYDDKFDVTEVNLLSAGCGKKEDGGLCWDNVIAGKYTELRVEFFNHAFSSGKFSFVENGLVYSGPPEDGFSHTFNPSKVTEFIVDFDDLSKMKDSEPKLVQQDVTNRDNSFSVRLYDTSTDDMVYELSVYHHIDKKEKDKHGAGEDVSSSVEVKINGNVGVYASTIALSRAATILPSLDDAVEVIVASRNEEGSGMQ